MDKEIYIVRHGRTDFNRKGIWQGSGVDASLDEVGRQQAQAFYKEYSNKNFDLVIHSELKRSRETVLPFVKDGLPTLEMREINEISWGKYEGRPHTEESYAAYREMINAWSEGILSHALEGGESAEALFVRMERFKERLKTLTYNRILVCSHGRAIRAMIAVLKEESVPEMEKYEHANTGVFKCQLRSDRFIFTTYNNIDHFSWLS